MGLSKLRTSSRLDTQFLDSRSKEPLCSSSHGGVRNYSVLSLVDSVIEEIVAFQGENELSVGQVCRLGLSSDEELVVDKPGKWVLQKSLLLAFRKDSDRLLLAVAQKPDGKKNWMVTEQNGATSSIKPQQVTYIVPGVESFNHMGIPNLVEKADKNLVEELLRSKSAKEEAERELLEFVQLLKSAKSMPPHTKPPKESWTIPEKA